MSFDFDTVVDRRGTHSAKWDNLEAIYGISPDEGLAMWVADMDFRAPDCVNEALAEAVRHGVYGYYGDDRSYREAITGWMARRHGWAVEKEWISTVHGLVAGTALCVQAWSEPGDSVILFTPVYHAFHKIIRANDREILQSPLKRVDGVYRMDLDTLATQLTGRERIVVLCSPHNPGGRVWSAEELRALAAFCAEHDLILVSDEVHHDLVLPGAKHTVAAVAAPEHLDRIVVMAATSKTFNLAGGMTGNVIISDPDLRAAFTARHQANGASPNRFGMIMAEAAYSGGDAWLDALLDYLAGNARIFDSAMNALPGVRTMPMQATYLSWVDFSGTGMTPEEFTRRVEKEAKVLPNHGAPFGNGGATWLRFNLATPRARVEEAAARISAAFADLQ
ncbi:pyridoxal phosphate-dependent aminotransferase [Paroceanicella profunda]|uniref:cysteine-S-conjugate beta-lyase n=1 Tax=Paroceanicella profunda TaxID=2579971 RepID=A0A5B8G141_9RHOB|nr:MalY/PatB family protein [Paroceanicella profunda]QDL92163.1 pyridoxal phosphate-dependent aminotransferase [Paroceanicella profunda]